MSHFPEITSPQRFKGMGKEINVGRNSSTVTIEGMNSSINIQVNVGNVKIEGMNHQVMIGENRGRVVCEGMGHTIVCQSGNPPQDTGMNNTIQFGNGSVPNNSTGQGSRQQSQGQQQFPGQAFGGQNMGGQPFQQPQQFEFRGPDGQVYHFNFAPGAQAIFGPTYYGSPQTGGQAGNTGANTPHANSTPGGAGGANVQSSPYQSVASNGTTAPIVGLAEVPNPPQPQPPQQPPNPAPSSYPAPSNGQRIPANVYQQNEPAPSFVLRCNSPDCESPQAIKTFAKVICSGCTNKTPREMVAHMDCLVRWWAPVLANPGTCTECLHCDNQVLSIVVFRD